MYHVYDTVIHEDGTKEFARVTGAPVSFNYLQSNLFQGIDMPWNKISEMKAGEAVDHDHFKIVRAEYV